MKNFGINRHKKRENDKKVEATNQVVRIILQRRLGIPIGSIPPWQRKKDTKTQP